jgi:ribosome-associated protein
MKRVQVGLKVERATTGVAGRATTGVAGRTATEVAGRTKTGVAGTTATGIQQTTAMRVQQTTATGLIAERSTQATHSLLSNLPLPKTGERPDVSSYSHIHDAAPDLDWFQGKSLNTEQLPRWLRVTTSPKPVFTTSTGPLELRDVLTALESCHANNITTIDLRLKCNHAQFMVICDGNSTKHVYALAESIRMLAKNRYVPSLDMPHNLEVQGCKTEDWLSIDLGSIIVNCFTSETRQIYDLEGVWSDSDLNSE